MATIETKCNVKDKVLFYCDDLNENVKGVVTEVNATISKTEKDIWYRIKGPMFKSSTEYTINEKDIVSVNNKLI